MHRDDAKSHCVVVLGKRRYSTDDSAEPFEFGQIAELENLAKRTCSEWFDRSMAHFQKSQKLFIKSHGGNEDSTLKNTKFVEFLEVHWSPEK
jgi:hypothetical protein